jgi:hypothetical protein
VPLLQLAFKYLCFFQLESATVLCVGQLSEEQRRSTGPGWNELPFDEQFAEIQYEAPAGTSAGCLNTSCVGHFQYLHVSMSGSQDQADDCMIIGL